jgi:hypothetical protein
MVSTVTTTVSNIAMTASLALLAIVVLIILLIQKEIVAVSEDQRLQAWGRVINVAIVPLLLCFGFIAVVTVLEVLR